MAVYSIFVTFRLKKNSDRGQLFFNHDRFNFDKLLFSKILHIRLNYFKNSMLISALCNYLLFFGFYP